jgi:DNA-binding response OmpR family regulator
MNESANTSFDAPTVLLIEDDPSLRETCRQQMMAHGYVVIVADSFRGAKAVLKHHHTIIDKVICNAFLPDADGTTALRHICEVLSLPCQFVRDPLEWSALFSSLGAEKPAQS